MTGVLLNNLFFQEADAVATVERFNEEALKYAGQTIKTSNAHCLGGNVVKKLANLGLYSMNGKPKTK